jgi:hypothetical protein
MTTTIADAHYSAQAARARYTKYKSLGRRGQEQCSGGRVCCTIGHVKTEYRCCA